MKRGYWYMYRYGVTLLTNKVRNGGLQQKFTFVEASVKIGSDKLSIGTGYISHLSTPHSSSMPFFLKARLKAGRCPSRSV